MKIKLQNNGWACKVPRKCQVDAYEQITQNNIGILNMTCGAGKTDVQIKTVFDFDVVLHVSPRKILVSEHSEKYEGMLKSTGYNIIQINSDLNNSEEFVEGEKTVFFINIQSLNVFENLNIVPDAVIVDEAHYMTDTIVNSKLIEEVENVYLFTATPNTLLSSNYPEIFTYLYSEALLDGCVCDFNISVIKEKEENAKKVIAELKKKMKENNLYKCIVYLNGSHLIENRKELVVDDFKNIPGVLTLTGKNVDKNPILNKFKNSKTTSILVSCQTISMGYDMKDCDCVLIDRPGNSISDNVQRFMRCLRLGKPNKSPIVFLRIPDLDLDKLNEENGYKESSESEDSGIDSDIDSQDITENVKKSQFSKIMLIINCLRKGLGLETLEEYVFRKVEEKENIIKECEDKIQELKESQNVNKDINAENNDNVTVNEKISSEIERIESIKNGKIKKLDKEITKAKQNTFPRKFIDSYFTDNEIKVYIDKNSQKIYIKGKTNEENWFTMAKKVHNFTINNNNKLPSQTSKHKEEKRLGTWCSWQRYNYKKEKLNEDKKDFFKDKSYWFWEIDLDEVWFTIAEKVEQFAINNNKLPSHSSKNVEEKSLATWCKTQRKNYKKKKLSEEKINFFKDKSYWFWEIDKDEVWFTTANKVHNYAIKNDNKLPSHSSKDKKEKSLGMWCDNRRANYKKGKLSDEQIDFFKDKTYWFWQVDKDDWFTIAEKVDEFVINNNNKLPSQTSKHKEEKSLCTWCDTQRSNYKKGKLSDKQINFFKDKSYWFWQVDKDDWFTIAERLNTFVINNNNKLPLITSKDKKEKSLYMWCDRQRSNHKKSKLSEEQINFFKDKSYWFWKIDRDDWFVTAEKVHNFTINNNNKLPSVSSKNSEEKSLGMWCDNQRQNYKKNKLNEEQIDFFKDKTYWFWQVDLDDDWFTIAKRLDKFVINNNNKLPLITSKDKKEKSLYMWCDRQRSNHKKNKLSDERIDFFKDKSYWYWDKDKKTQQLKPPKSQKKLVNKNEHLTREELILKLNKLEQCGEYNAPNPEFKDNINSLIAKSTSKRSKGKIIVLDDPEFKTCNAILQKLGKSCIKDLIVPQRDAKSFQTMNAHEIFGTSVVHADLQDVLNECKDPVKCVYADLMGPLSSEEKYLNRITKLNLTKNAVVAFTVSARDCNKVEYTNKYATELLDKMYKNFPNSENLVTGPVFVYGNKARMATCVFKVNLK